LFTSLSSLLYLTLLSLSALTLSACASQSAEARSMRYSAVSVEVVDAQGYPLPTYHHRGKVYVQGEYGARYQLKLHNRGSRRVEAVVTVDGRDVINGQLGSYDHRGYVIDPYGDITIEGFRKSDTEVATFRFTTPGDSYSGRMGSAQHVGVIGVAIFEERRPPRRRPRPIRPSSAPQFRADVDSASEAPEAEVSTGAGYGRGVGGLLAEDSSSPSSDAPAPTTSAKGSAAGRGAAGLYSRRHSRRRSRKPTQKSELGTRYGEARYSEVEEVSFVRRSSRPQHVWSFSYDSEQGLRRRGVIPRPPSGPSAFPAEPRYAPPPP
jgi:hypothetical protein